MYYPVTILSLSWYQRAVQFIAAHLLPCPSRKYLHIQCPGCGLQRSFVALLQGHPLDSFVLYPATVPIIVLFIFLCLHLWYRYRNGALWLRRIYLFCAAVVVLQYVYKIASNQLIVP